ncbi:hypothetical protein Tco_1462616 [Tanacetum coccineum]
MDKPTIEDDYGYHQSKQTIHSQLWMIMLSTKDDETELAREVKQHLETEGNGDLIVEDVPESLIKDRESVDLDAKNMNDNVNNGGD